MGTWGDVGRDEQMGTWKDIWGMGGHEQLRRWRDMEGIGDEGR